MVGQGVSNPDSSNTNKEAKTDMLIDSAEDAEMFYQTLEIKVKTYKVHYKDPRLQLMDKMVVRKLLESVYTDEDVEEVLRE